MRRESVVPGGQHVMRVSVSLDMILVSGEVLPGETNSLLLTSYLYC